MAPFTYKSIRLAAYAPVPGAAWTASYYTLALPEHARRQLLDLYRIGLRNPDRCRSVPIKRFNNLLQALAPDVMSVAKWIDVERNEPWLYAHRPVPTDVFATLFHTWMQDLRPEPEHRMLVSRLFRDLSPGDMEWKRRDVPMLAQKLTEDGTAQPEDLLYQLLPDALVTEALKLKPFRYDGGQLRFRAVARRPSDRGAEMFSWPPDRYTDKDGAVWYYSAVIGVRLHSVPFDSALRMHVRTGVRRWATRTGKNGLWLPPRQATSAYLLADAPWIADAPESWSSERFSVSRLRYDRQRGELGWEAGGTNGMLSRLSFDRPFPEPGDLVRKPAAWLRGARGVTAAVVHRNAMGSHGVLPGLMPGDRIPLTRWFEQAVPPSIRRVPDLVRAERHPVRPLPYRPARPEPEIVPAPMDAEQRVKAALRASIAETTDGAPLELEFLWNTTAHRIAAVTALATVLGLDGDGRTGEDETHVWKTPELTVSLRLERVGELAAALDVSPDKRPRTAALHEAIARRRKTVVRHLPTRTDTTRPSLALVEILHPKSYAPRRVDPKFALRLGFRDARRVTQFLVTPRRPDNRETAAKARHEKLKSCWEDGLRQLGHRVVPRHSLAGSVPEGLQYAALWLVKRRADGPTGEADLVPVAVRLRPEAEEQQTVMGWEHRSGTWMPYPELLMRLADQADLPLAENDDEDQDEETGLDPGGEAEAVHTTEPEHKESAGSGRRERQLTRTAAAVQELLFGLRDRPTLLLVHAQNTRGLWPWLQNACLRRDRLQLHGGPVQRLELQGPGLRIVRVRDHSDDETPQWWGYEEAWQKDEDQEPGERAGIPTGLWKEPLPEDGDSTAGNRVFFSTGPKEGPGTNVSVMASRWALRPHTKAGSSGTTIDTGRVAWNPGLLEITVAACQQGDDPEAWAALTHQLRRSPDYGRSVLALPLPLHLARKTSEYVLPTSWAEEEPSEEESTAAVQLTFDFTTEEEQE
ncbi:pPIWI_RE module domain-containing protein [Streptomyces griseus]